MEPEDDFTPSMDKKLNELNAAVGSIGDDLDKGVLSPEDHGALMGQIEPQRQQLKAAKQGAMQRAIQSQRQIAAENNAFSTSMEERDRAFHASNFHDRLVHVANPFSPDETQTGYVNHRGDFEPIDFSVGKDQGEDQPLDNFSPTIGMVPGENGTSPNSPAQHTMNVNVGDQQSQAAFNQGAGGWQQTGQQRFNNQTGRWEDMPVGSAMGGTQAPEQAAGPHGQITDSEMKTFASQAQVAARSLGLQPGTQAFNNAAGHAFNNLMQGRQQQKEREFMRSERERSTLEEHRRQEQARSEIAIQKKADAEDAAKEKSAKHEEDSLNTAYHQHLGKITSEAEKADRAEATALTDEEKAHAAKMRKPYHESQEAMEAEAMARARRQRSMVKGNQEEKKPSTDAGGGGRKGGGDSVVPFPGKGGFTAHQQDRVEKTQPAPAAQPAPQPAPQEAPGVGDFIVQQGGEEQPVRSIVGEAAENIGNKMAEAGSTGVQQAGRVANIPSTIAGYARGTAANAKEHAIRAWRRLVGYDPKKK